MPCAKGSGRQQALRSPCSTRAEGQRRAGKMPGVAQGWTAGRSQSGFQQDLKLQPQCQLCVSFTLLSATLPVFERAAAALLPSVPARCITQRQHCAPPTAAGQQPRPWARQDTRAVPKRGAGVGPCPEITGDREVTSPTVLQDTASTPRRQQERRPVRVLDEIKHRQPDCPSERG